MLYKIFIPVSALILMIIMLTVGVFADDIRAGEEIHWWVMAGGGSAGNSTSFKLRGTISQTATGAGASGSIVLHHGYYQDLAGSFLCDCVPGEVDGTSPINLLDILYAIDYKYKSGPAPVPYETCSADVNCDCIVNLLDILYLIDFKYKSGPAPCDCDDWVTACGVPIYK